MADWVRKLGDFLKLNDREILPDAGRISAKIAKELAEREYTEYSDYHKAIGAPVDVSDFERYVRRIESSRSSS